MKLLYDMIHERAGKSWSAGMITRENYSLWADHWLTCARNLERDFESGGLFETAAALRRIIVEQSKINEQSSQPNWTKP